MTFEAAVKNATFGNRGGIRALPFTLIVDIAFTKGNLMDISFVWNGDKPDYPPLDQIEDSVSFALRHLGESRGPKPATLIVHLSMDKFSSSVGGVGYSPDETPLFVSTYNLTTRVGTCDHYGVIA